MKNLLADLSKTKDDDGRINDRMIEKTQYEQQRKVGKSGQRFRDTWEHNSTLNIHVTRVLEEEKQCSI